MTLANQQNIEPFGKKVCVGIGEKVNKRQTVSVADGVND